MEIYTEAGSFEIDIEDFAERTCDMIQDKVKEFVEMVVEKDTVKPDDIRSIFAYDDSGDSMMNIKILCSVERPEYKESGEYGDPCKFFKLKDLIDAEIKGAGFGDLPTMAKQFRELADYIEAKAQADKEG